MRACREANCQAAMEAAQSQLGIPMVVTPKNFASRELDELSAMTYLSYYMSEGSPGYKATLNWVKLQIPSVPVDNFDVSLCVCIQVNCRFTLSRLTFVNDR